MSRLRYALVGNPFSPVIFTRRKKSPAPTTLSPLQGCAKHEWLIDLVGRLLLSFDFLAQPVGHLLLLCVGRQDPVRI
jgi:hypothetical protein